MSFLSILPAVIGAAGSLIGGRSSARAQARANETNIQLSRENRAWEEMMSNTAYQRGTEDMIRAGINPMLAVSQGGASTPNTSAATVQPVDAMGKGIASAADKAANAVATSLSLERARTENNILDEKLKQERLTTNEQIALKDVGQVARTIEEREASTRLRVDEARIKSIERQIAEQTIGANVSSAQARATLANQEVNLNEIRAILMKLDIPEKQAMAKWFETIGAGSPALKATMSITQWLKFILGR